jgi:hypothetical protein
MKGKEHRNQKKKKLMTSVYCRDKKKMQMKGRQWRETNQKERKKNKIMEHTRKGPTVERWRGANRARETRRNKREFFFCKRRDEGEAIEREKKPEGTKENFFCKRRDEGEAVERETNQKERKRNFFFQKMRWRGGSGEGDKLEGKKENKKLQKTRRKERDFFFAKDEKERKRGKKTLQSTRKGRQQQGEGKLHGKNTAEYVEKRKNTKKRTQKKRETKRITHVNCEAVNSRHHSCQLRGWGAFPEYKPREQKKKGLHW